MNKQHLVFRIVALVGTAVMVWFFVQTLVGDFSTPALAAVIAIGVVGLGALLVWNQSLRRQLLVAALICSTIAVLFRVLISNDPSQHVRKELRGSWQSIATEGHPHGAVTLNFVDDQSVDIGLSNVQRCKYEITRNQEIVIADRMTSSTYEIVHLENDSLALKMEFETLYFVRERSGPH